MDTETKSAISAEFDRMIGVMGIGELRAQIQHQTKLLDEVRHDLKQRPTFNPQTCVDQQADIDHVKTTLFGPYDKPGGVVGEISDLNSRVKLLLWIVVFLATTSGGVLTYAIAELAVKALSKS